MRKNHRFIAMLCFDGTGVLWFLPAYFFASVLVYLLLTYYKRYCFIAVSFLLCIAYCLSWFSNITACAIWGRCFMGSVFMILGYVMAPFFQMIPNLKMRRRYLIILLCLVANILMVYMNKVSCDMFSLHYGNVLLYLGESITGSAFLILLCMNIRTYKLLLFIGENSLLFFVIHGFMPLFFQEIVWNGLSLVLHYNVLNPPNIFLGCLSDILRTLLFLLLEIPLVLIIKRISEWGKKKSVNITHL